MSDSDGYSASSGYLYFSEKSGTPVEGKTVKSDTFSAIVELNAYLLFIQLLANLSFTHEIARLPVRHPIAQQFDVVDAVMETPSCITSFFQFLRRNQPKSVELACFSG